jgi:hypothetical protein
MREAGSACTPTHDRLESIIYSEQGAKIFEFKGLTGKIWKTREITSKQPFSVCHPNKN